MSILTRKVVYTRLSVLSLARQAADRELHEGKREKTCVWWRWLQESEDHRMWTVSLIGADAAPKTSAD